MEEFEVIDLNLQVCIDMMTKYILDKSALGNEDIGEL